MSNKALIVIDVQNDFCPGGRVGRAMVATGRAGRQPLDGANSTM